MKRQDLKYFLAGSVSLITFVVYLKALENGFVGWDDNEYVYNNPYIRSFDIAFFRWSFFDFYSANWHPLTWISHAADYAVWGLNPLGHHLTNNILHAINTFLVVLLAARLVEVARPFTIHDSQFTLIAAAVTGLLFGIHPLHVESVAWVSERKDLLCALFFLLSIMAYVKYANAISLHSAEVKEQRTVSSMRYALCPMLSFKGAMLSALCFFFLALLSKPMAVSLPLVLLILDWYPLARIQSVKSFCSAFIGKIPFIALSLISSILTVMAQKSVRATSLMDTTPTLTRLLVAVKSLISYLWNIILPLNLTPFYSYPKYVSISSLKYLLASVLVTGITAACIINAKKQKLWLAVWGYYVITLAPVLGIVQVGSQSMADRYMYLPSIGPFLIIGLAAGLVTRKLHGLEKSVLLIKFITAVASIILFTAMTYLTIRQIGVWRNSFELWNYVIEKEPESGSIAYNGRTIAYYNLACAYALSNNTEEACRLLGKSVKDGFKNWEHIMKDSDLDSIRNAPCYQEIIKGM